MKGFAGRSAAPGIKILEIQQKCTRNDINENYVKDRKYVRKYIKKNTRRRDKQDKSEHSLSAASKSKSKATQWTFQ